MSREENRPGPATRAQRLNVSQARVLGARASGHLIVTAVVTVFGVALFGKALATTLLLAWLGSLVFIGLAQARLIERISLSGSSDEATLGTSELLIACTCAAGLAWGLMGLYVATHTGFTQQTFTLLLILCLVVSAVPAIAMRLGAFSLYLIATLGPLTLTLLFRSELPSRTLGVLLVMLCAFTLVAAWRYSQALSRAAALHLEGEEMSGVLRQMQARIIAAEEETRQED